MLGWIKPGKYWHIHPVRKIRDCVGEMIMASVWFRGPCPRKACFGIMRQCKIGNFDQSIILISLSGIKMSKLKRGATPGSARLRRSGISCPNACKFPHLDICEKRVSYNNEMETGALTMLLKKEILFRLLVIEGMQDYIYCPAPGRSVI